MIEAKETNSNNQSLFRGLARLVLYTFLSLSIFFGIAVLIFILRGEDSSRNPMPSLVGKHYVDVHGDLVRLQLRVNIEKKQYHDQGSGVILYQSLATGTMIGPHEKLTLVVNQPEPLLRMPDLKQNNLETARASLDSIVYEERVYRLSIATVTELESDSYPDNTVLAQFPEPGIVVRPDQKVYLLVSRKPGQTQKPEDIKLESLVGQNAAVLMDYLQRMGRDYRITSIHSATSRNENASIAAIQPGNPVALEIKYSKSEVRFQNGWEIVKVELDEPGRCIAEVRDLELVDEILGSGLRQVFVTQNHTPDEEVTILFFRRGSSELKVSCGKSTVFQTTFEPDDLG